MQVAEKVTRYRRSSWPATSTPRTLMERRGTAQAVDFVSSMCPLRAATRFRQAKRESDKKRERGPPNDVDLSSIRALLDFLLGVGFAMPAVDLRPADNAGLHATAGK
jgi:hypothetical protein